jgi:hypothetical protein
MNQLPRWTAPLIAGLALGILSMSGHWLVLLTLLALLWAYSRGYRLTITIPRRTHEDCPDPS